MEFNKREDNNGNIYYNHILRKKEAEDTNLSASTAGVYLSSAKDSIAKKEAKNKV